jgi:hypothetical protein
MLRPETAIGTDVEDEVDAELADELHRARLLVKRAGNGNVGDAQASGDCAIAEAGEEAFHR